jgi:hypothetical protein
MPQSGITGSDAGPNAQKQFQPAALSPGYLRSICQLFFACRSSFIQIYAKFKIKQEKS